MLINKLLGSALKLLLVKGGVLIKKTRTDKFTRRVRERKRILNYENFDDFYRIFGLIFRDCSFYLCVILCAKFPYYTSLFFYAKLRVNKLEKRNKKLQVR